MKLEIRKLILICIGFYSLVTFAQKGGLNGVGVTVINPKEIKIDTAERVYGQASDYVDNNEAVVQNVSFDFGYKPQVSTQNIKTMVAMYRLKIDKADDSKSGFVRAGAGNYGNTLLDFYYGSRVNKKVAWGVNANHIGAINGPVAKKLSSYSNNRVGIQGKYFMGNYLFSAAANYERTVSRNYSPAFTAFGTKKKASKESSYGVVSALVKKNPANNVFFDLGLSSINTKKALQFDFNTSPNYFILNDSLSEFSIKNHFVPSYKLSAGTIYLTTNFDFSTLNGLKKYSRNLINVRPSFEHFSEDKRLLGEIGLIFNGVKDSTLDKKLSIYPFLKASYLVSKEYQVMVRGQLSGGMTQQLLKDAYTNNIWLGNFAPNTSNNKLAIKTSVEAAPITNFKAKFKFDYTSIENFNYFSPSNIGLGYFVNTHAQDVVNVVNPGLELSYDFLAGHGIKCSLDAFNYTSKDRLLYTPNLVTGLEIFYKLKKNFKLSSDISYISGLVGANNVKMKSILDLNIKGQYTFNDKMGAFIHANNLIGKNYQYFDGYATQGINILAGLTVNF